MKKIIGIFVILLTVFTGCAKDEDKKDSTNKFAPSVYVTNSTNPTIGKTITLNLAIETNVEIKESKFVVLNPDTEKELDIASTDKEDTLNKINEVTKVLKISKKIDFRVEDKIDSSLYAKLYTVKITIESKNGEKFDFYSKLEIANPDYFSAAFDVKYMTEKSSLTEGKDVILEKQAIAFDAGKSRGGIDEYEYIIRKDGLKKEGIVTKKILYGLSASGYQVTENMSFIDNFGDYDIQLQVKKDGFIRAVSPVKRITVVRKGYVRQVSEKDGKLIEISVKGGKSNTEIELLPYYASPTQISGKKIVWTIKNKATGEKATGVSLPDPKTMRIKWTPNDNVLGNDFVEYSITYAIYDREKVQVITDYPSSFIVTSKDSDEIQPVLPEIVPEITIYGEMIQGQKMKFVGNNISGNVDCTFKWKIYKDKKYLTDIIDLKSEVMYTFVDPGNYEVELTISKEGEKEQTIKKPVIIGISGNGINITAVYNEGKNIQFTAPTGYLKYNFIIKNPSGIEKIILTSKNTIIFTGIWDDNDNLIAGIYKGYVELLDKDGTVIESNPISVEVK